MMKKDIQKIIQLHDPKFVLCDDICVLIILEYLFLQLKGLFRSLPLLFFFKNPIGIQLGKSITLRYISHIKWGKYLKIGDYVELNAMNKTGLHLGDNVSIGSFSKLIVSTSLDSPEDCIHIGNNVTIGEYAYIGGSGGLSIADNCIIGQYFSCHPETQRATDLINLNSLLGIKRKAIKIADNCWIGSKVTILDGVQIRSKTIIAAGSVVTKSFPENVVIGGVPAKIIKHRDELGNKYDINEFIISA